MAAHPSLLLSLNRNDRAFDRIADALGRLPNPESAEVSLSCEDWTLVLTLDHPTQFAPQRFAVYQIEIARP